MNVIVDDVYCTAILVREIYENLPTKLLPNNFFTNMLLEACNNMY